MLEEVKEAEEKPEFGHRATHAKIFCWSVDVDSLAYVCGMLRNANTSENLS